MSKALTFILPMLLICLSFVAVFAQQPQAMAADEWSDSFNGEALDPAKWERFSFEGGNGGKLKVAAMQKLVLDSFKRARLDKVFEIVDSLEAAIR